jgi:hypothetical protein
MKPLGLIVFAYALILPVSATLQVAGVAGALRAGAIAGVTMIVAWSVYFAITETRAAFGGRRPGV